MLGRGDAKFFKVEGVSAAVPSLEQGSTHGGRASRPAHCLFLSLHFRVARECLHYKGILSSYGRNQSTLKAQKYALLGLGREVCWPWAGAKPAPSAPILPASACSTGPCPGTSWTLSGDFFQTSYRLLWRILASLCLNQDDY